MRVEVDIVLEKAMGNNNNTFILRKFHTEMFRCASQLKEKLM